MYILIVLLVLAAGMGLFAYLDARARRQADEAWTAFSDRKPRMAYRPDFALPPGVSVVNRGRYTATRADEVPSAYVTSPSTGYSTPVTESILVAQSAYESSVSSCSYDSSSSYSDSSSSSSCDSGSSSCSCD